jgi:DNA-binding CsgD family transcriptional regulator
MTKAHARIPKAASAVGLSGRQQEVFALLARGMTNKEIGFSLGITERGVAAQVSRMLAKFGAPNRGGLIARVMSDHLGAPASDAAAGPFEFTAEMRKTCESYAAATFMVGLTLGPDNLLVYVNDASRKIMGIGVEARESDVFRTRRASSGTSAFVQGSKDAFRTGLPVTLQGQPARWMRDDGSWDTGIFSCVLQPVRRLRAVIGVLWICSPA